ncbi:MAG: (2Fe-2S)-binding protein [Phycisphaerales bacterium]|nr:MAG: (2Fe-2S)-binding protein [Phycisphaerales bacterium]
MQEHVTLTIDGAQISAVKGTSVLDTAMEFGICIPHLCHYAGLSDVGACRLCIVEHVVNGRSKVTTSCRLNVAEGMVILTDTEKIRRLRRNIAELLVAQAPNSRAVQDIAVRCGVREVRYPFHNDNCVRCGRCVRVCSEMWQADAIGFIGRGKDRHVDFPFGRKPDFCKTCNTCIDICAMTITPCPGPMKQGEERLCSACEGQLMMTTNFTDSCVWCEMGRCFGCTRQLQTAAHQ